MSLLDQASESTETKATEGEEQQAQIQEEQSSETHETSESSEHENSEASPEPWYLTEDVAGSEERPDWFQTKFKSVSEQARAFSEAEKKLGAFKGAPDEYELSLEEMPDVKLESGDPMISEFLADAKANNVSQDYVTKLLSTYVKAVRMNNPDPKAEMEKLGPNGMQDITILGNWAKNNLSPEETSVFKNMITTADTVRVLQKLRGVMTQADTQPAPSVGSTSSKAQILKKIHDPRYAKDEDFRNKVKEELSQFG